MTHIRRVHLGPPPSHQIVGDPRELWPRETDFHRWLVGNLGRLAPCLGMQRLDLAGHEVLIGERWTHTNQRGHEQTVGGWRVDVTAHNELGHLVVIEAQFGPPDHTHLGQLLAYAHVAQASAAVWVVVDTDPLFYADHLSTLAELNEVYAGRRHFAAVAVTWESEPSPDCPAPDTPLSPRLRRITLPAGRDEEGQVPGSCPVLPLC